MSAAWRTAETVPWALRGTRVVSPATGIGRTGLLVIDREALQLGLPVKAPQTRADRGCDDADG